MSRTLTGDQVIRQAVPPLLVAALAILPMISAADQLVVRLDALATSVSAPRAGDPTPAQQRVAVPSGLPTTLRLSLAAKADGNLGLSLRQKDLDDAVESSSEPVMRVRVLSPAVGDVSEDAVGTVSVSMDTALAFDDLTTGKSRIFDVRIRGGTDGDVEYGVALPIFVEAWRRSEDDKPVENRTKENRSFWGTLPGHFEP